jgi:hypothetical protein
VDIAKPGREPPSMASFLSGTDIPLGVQFAFGHLHE